MSTIHCQRCEDNKQLQSRVQFGASNSLCIMRVCMCDTGRVQSNALSFSGWESDHMCLNLPTSGGDNIWRQTVSEHRKRDSNLPYTKITKKPRHQGEGCCKLFDNLLYIFHTQDYTAHGGESMRATVSFTAFDGFDTRYTGQEAPSVRPSSHLCEGW